MGFLPDESYKPLVYLLFKNPSLSFSILYKLFPILSLHSNHGNSIWKLFFPYLEVVERTSIISLSDNANETLLLEDVTTVEELRAPEIDLSKIKWCGTKNYFLWDEPILQELVREFWKNAQTELDCIRSVVVGKEVAISVNTIAGAIN